MKILTTILLLLSISFTTAQTKRKLLKEIAETNSLHSKYAGPGGMTSPQYMMFEKLREKISNKELEKLTRHENTVVRLYAKQWMIQEGKGDPILFFLEEMKKDEFVDYYSGPLLNTEKSYSVVYYKYRNKITRDAVTQFKDYDSPEAEAAETKRLKEDKTMQKLDSIVLYSDKTLPWRLYENVISNREIEKDDLPQLKKLAFEKNNGYAFQYLFNNHIPQLKQEIYDYLQGKFLEHKYKDEEDVYSLHEILVLLLESKDEQYKKIAIAKLKSDKSWENHKDWFKKSIIERYHLQL